jgi:hypothetical protein
MSLTDYWTPDELRRFAEKEEKRRQINRERCSDYQKRKRRAVIQKLAGKCVECGQDDPAVLQIDEHDKKLSWSQRYKAILNGKSFRLLCATCNWKKRARLKEASGRPRHPL